MTTLSLSEISPFLLSSLKEHELIALLKDISSGFTSERERIGEYVSERERVSAYCSYYLPTNIPKLSFLLRQLKPEVLAKLEGLPLIDIGCGPGTYSVGWLSHFKKTQSIHLIDQSALMLEQARALIEGLGLAPEVATYTPGLPSIKGGVMLFGNSLNEMGIKRGLEYIDKGEPEFVILIEPGTKQSFSQVLPMREELIARGMHPLYPCATTAACPFKGLDDWCHQVLRLTHDPEIERLSQLIGLDRKVMPFIAHIYQRGALGSEREAHFLRFLTETKFSFMWQVCQRDEKGELHLEKFEMMKRDYPKKVVKQLQHASVGESFNFQVVKRLETHVRVRLTNFAGEVISTK